MTDMYMDPANYGHLMKDGGFPEEQEKSGDFDEFTKVRSKIFDEVAIELNKAVLKFPEWPTDPIHARSIIGEELGELEQAILECIYEPHKSNKDDVEKEAIQTTAMCVRFLMSLHKYKYEPSEQHKQV